MTTAFARPERRLTPCAAGSTLIEFALIAPLLIIMILAIIELGVVMFNYTVMEGATGLASRIGKTGYSASGAASREDYIKSQITRYAGGFIDPTQLVITIKSYTDFSKVGVPEPCRIADCSVGNPVAGVDYTDINCNGKWDADQGASDAGGAGSVVLYIVTYNWHLLTPPMRLLLGNQNGDFPLTAIATVQNENFPSTKGCGT